MVFSVENGAFGCLGDKMGGFLIFLLQYSGELGYNLGLIRRESLRHEM